MTYELAGDIILTRPSLVPPQRFILRAAHVFRLEDLANVVVRAVIAFA